ncbi:glycosyltransferase family 9 protein [Parazoarcus communis]|nr:glycosyltransferase family 9 protein [Parazoarcus communis]
MNAPEASVTDAAAGGMSRILLVRTSAIGDVVFASPFAEALRHRYPGAFIAWLVEPGIEGLLRGSAAVDALIVWPKQEWLGLLRARRYRELLGRVRAFSRELKAYRFDTAIDLQSLLKSGVLTWLSGARRRIGLASREGSRWLMTEVVPAGGQPGQISSEYRHLALRLGLSDVDFLPRLSLEADVRARVRDRLHRMGLRPGGYAVFAPFTTRPQKHWPEASWQRLALAVRHELRLVPVILGGAAERAAGERLAESGVAFSLAGETGLVEAAALVADAGLVIGVDTGLTHMGVAFARPTVALFGSTRPYLDVGRANASVIWLGVACSPCRRQPTCDGVFACLSGIEPERVVDEAKRVLQWERA